MAAEVATQTTFHISVMHQAFVKLLKSVYGRELANLGVLDNTHQLLN
jgi:hypothetical protein